jgi:ribonucleotide monophosphatase NagD (HAD superfamily)
MPQTKPPRLPSWAYKDATACAQVIAQAPAALERLHHPTDKRPRYPFVFMTNGGGVSEATRAEELEHMLRVPVTPEQVILGHTPMQACPSLRAQMLCSGLGSA